MNSDKVSRRNRANAAKSTGPRTAKGKAAVAQNARRHGVTARPDPGSVITWLRIILAEPDIAPVDLEPEDERGVRALALAEAEVRFVAAERALREFEGGTAPLDEEYQDLEKDVRSIEWHLEEPMSARHRNQGLNLLARMGRFLEQQTAFGGKRHRLLKRYLGEARSQRSLAFAAWLPWAAGREDDETLAA